MTMSEGPTTVGTIQGILKMDRSDWIKGVTDTEAEAERLGRLSPTITVSASTGEALAKLEALHSAADAAGAGGPTVSTNVGPSAGSAARVDAVAAAEKRLAVAMSAADSAYARASLNQMKLDALREKGKTTDIQLASAELTLSETMKRLDTANEKATASELALVESKKKAATASLEEAAANETVAASTEKAASSNQKNASRAAKIAGAVAILLPMMVPLAAGAVGIAGALAGMGTAGVLAILGIRNEMNQGTVAGDQFRNGLGVLRGDLNQLSQTSALTMLGAFKKAVGDAQAQMPFLNQQIADFSGLMGKTGGNLFNGALTALRVLNPLMLTAGAYVERLAEGFNSWTQNGGLQRFATYAMSVLPTVEGVLGQLASMVMHVLEALAPMGSVGLQVLTVLAGSINAIPVDVLSALIAAITWGTIAFKAWGFITPMLEGLQVALAGVGVATDVALGPIGWVAAAVAALSAVFIAVSASNSQATAAMQDYSQAVQEDSGIIGDNIKAKAAQQLQSLGAYDAATKLGISTKLVTDATLGNSDAQKELNRDLLNITDSISQATAKSQTMTNEQQAQLDAATKLRNGYQDQSSALQAQIAAYNVYQTAIGGVTISTDEQKAALLANAAAAAVSESAYLSAMSGQTDLATQTAIATAKMYLQNDAAGLLKQSLDALNGKTISAAAAQNQFDSQIANMADHMDAAGKNINRATTSLDDGSAAAVKNRGELINLVQAAEASAQAFRDNGGSVADTKSKMESMKQTIIDNAIAHGEDADQVHKYVDELFKIPTNIPTTHAEFEADTAKAKIDQFNAKLAEIQKTIPITVVMTTQQVTQYVNSQLPTPGDGSMLKKADGGTIPGLAGGGPGGTVSGPGNAFTDMAGLFRLADGEEVVSNKFGQADKNRPVLKAMNAGMVLKPSTGSSNGSQQPMSVTVEVVNKTGIDITSLVDFRIKKAAAANKSIVMSGRQGGTY
ncbi:hypothetical protein KPL76_06165 [Subtercola sp. PAMC28395]|uniref:hypothetical protein n=1 Tax=Subtercola sp. PAMC28395 TaxID=2846775 RepID=UPI001C0AEE24|nr:hypothetical protein [Subtercola sp. PAMC28395]QWT24938.1 hypothetical protein KPL76_06165 [Subtercola sp. PAMC28395]